MIPSSACQLWRADLPGLMQGSTATNADCYTTSRDTIPGAVGDGSSASGISYLDSTHRPLKRNRLAPSQDRQRLIRRHQSRHCRPRERLARSAASPARALPAVSSASTKGALDCSDVSSHQRGQLHPLQEMRSRFNDSDYDDLAFGINVNTSKPSYSHVFAADRRTYRWQGFRSQNIWITCDRYLR